MPMVMPAGSGGKPETIDRGHQRVWPPFSNVCGEYSMFTKASRSSRRGDLAGRRPTLRRPFPPLPIAVARGGHVPGNPPPYPSVEYAGDSG